MGKQREPESDNDVVRRLTRANGAKWVEQLVKDEYLEIQGRMNQLKLPDGYAFFREEDWHAWGGCSRFANGVEPVIGELTVEVDELPEGYGEERLEEEEILLGHKKSVLVLISADEDGLVRAVMGFFLGAGTLQYLHTFASLEMALSFCRLAQAGQFVLLSDLVKLGFSLENE